MHRQIPVVSAMIVAGVAVVCASGAAGQTAGAPVLVSTRTSLSAGRVQGIVRDEAGAAIDGASVLAMGDTIASVRSDIRGRFTLALPPGDYVLRATRTGYVSTARLPVRVQTAVLLERNITLTRQENVAAPDELDDSHAHTELAWRLRHLTRSVLRDGETPVPTDAPPADRITPGGSLFNRAIGESARIATSFFTQTDFDGQVNYLATGYSTSAAHWMPADWPRSVAYVAVGAPVGTAGDWRVRGAIAPGQASSWVLVGQYEGREEATHAIRFGVSYGSQGVPSTPNGVQWSGGTSYARRVAGMYGADRWTISPALRLDYGLRLDRYDYIEAPQLASGHAGLRARVLPGTFVVGGASRNMVAPGAEEFLPPSTGPWLPPERTFSALVPGGPLRAEDIRHAEVGLVREFSAGGRPTALGVRRFYESSATQMATLFGLDDTRGLGHYFVGSPGDVDVSGWIVGFSSRFADRVDTRMEYTVADAAWTLGAQAATLSELAPITGRPVAERLHDFTATVDADLRETATRITFVFRTDSAFVSGPGRATGGRFNVQVHQALPYQPLGRGKLELVFAARTLFRDGRAPGAFYDELLTIAPPLRFTAGVQVRF